MVNWWCGKGFWHRYETVKDTGLTRYQQCRRCALRRAVQGGEGFYATDTPTAYRLKARIGQPINMHWVRTGVWQTMDPPRPNRHHACPGKNLMAMDTMTKHLTVSKENV